MTDKQILRNYTILIIGLFIMSFGVSLSVKSNLGTTPISCIPNVISYASTLSLGMITIIFNMLLILIQVLILKSDFPRIQYLQLPVTIIFGYFIDFTLWIIKDLNPTDYISQWIFCIISCFVIAFGVLLEVESKAIVLPGEGVSLAVRHVTGMDFGKLKTIFDTSNVVIGAVISLILFGTFRGVGPGTVFAGIVVGYIVRLYRMIITKYNNKPINN